LKLIVDLSHTIRVGMPVYPGTPTFRTNNICTHEVNGFAELELNFSSHVGTHVDAPMHIIKGAKTLTDFPPSKFMGTALKIDCQTDNSNLISQIESKIELFGKPDFILLCTGWSKHWGSNNYFAEFPLPDNKTFEYIAELKIKGIGIDAISIDRLGSEEFVNHKLILKRDLIIIENLADLESLPERLFDFFCFPLKIENGDGSPVRAVAKYSE
jgi:arylformamidase